MLHLVEHPFASFYIRILSYLLFVSSEMLDLLTDFFAKGERESASIVFHLAEGMLQSISSLGRDEDIHPFLDGMFGDIGKLAYLGSEMFPEIGERRDVHGELRRLAFRASETHFSAVHLDQERSFLPIDLGDLKLQPCSSGILRQHHAVGERDE